MVSGKQGEAKYLRRAEVFTEARKGTPGIVERPLKDVNEKSDFYPSAQALLLRSLSRQ